MRKETCWISWLVSQFFLFNLIHALRYQGLFRTALPSFKALRELEWIGYPEMRADMVQAVLASHPHLQSLGLM
jgi:hypothetical protein